MEAREGMEVLGNCRNCKTSFKGKYCYSCGQKKYDRVNFRLKDFLKDIFEEIFDFDSKIFLTLRYLITKPGKLTVDFLDGRQKAYIGPVKLYLIIITLNFLVYSFFDNYSPVNVEYLMTWGVNDWFKDFILLQQLNSGQVESAYYHDLNLKVNNVFSFALYLLIFIYPLILRKYFYKSNKYYIEHLIFCLHFMSFGFLRDTLFLPVHIYDKNLGSILSFLTTIVYLFYAIKVVYQSNGIKRWVNSLVLYGLFLILFSLTILFSIAFSIVLY